MLYVDDSLPIEKLREKFSCDTYATETTGARVIDAKKGHSVVELPLCDRRVEVVDEEGRPVATTTATGARVG